MREDWRVDGYLPAGRFEPRSDVRLHREAAGGHIGNGLGDVPPSYDEDGPGALRLLLCRRLGLRPEPRRLSRLPQHVPTQELLDVHHPVALGRRCVGLFGRLG